MFPKWFYAVIGSVFTFFLVVAFPAGFGALPPARQAYWLSRFSASRHPGPPAPSDAWSVYRPDPCHPWVCDWQGFVTFHNFYLLGGFLLAFAVLYVGGFFLNALSAVLGVATAALCRRSPALRRLVHPLDSVPELVGDALRCGLSPADIQAHFAQALHRETPEYRAAYKAACAWSTGSLVRRRALEQELNPWLATGKAQKQEFTEGASK